MSKIEDIYKQLEGEIPSADFSLDSSGEEVLYYNSVFALFKALYDQFLSSNVRKANMLS